VLVTDTVVPTFTLPVIVILEEPNDTGNLLTSVTDEPALITITSAG
jgi:hypothetical protein